MVAQDHVPNQYLVRLEAGWEVADWLAFARAQVPIDLPLRSLQEVAPDLDIYLIGTDTLTPLDESLTLAWLRKLPGQRGIQYNHYVNQRHSPLLVPNDPEFAQQWAFANTGQNGGLIDADIDAVEAWDISRSDTNAWGDPLVVAILDDGFELSHPDVRWFQNQGEIPENGIDDDQNGYVDDVQGWNVGDENGRIPVFSHGTLVAGVVGGITDNELGISGVGLGTQVLPVAGIFNLESEVVAAYHYVLRMRRQYDTSGGQQGAFIVATNASFGKDREDPADFPLWCGIYDDLGQAGILSVVATANDGYDVDQLGDVPSACTSPWMIAVTGTDRTDVKVDRAAFGLTSVDLGAPGSQIFTTDLGNSYGLVSGTSYAAPMVAGAIPMVIGRASPAWLSAYTLDPAAGALTVRDILLHTIDSLPSLQGKVLSGGRLNLRSAVLAMGANDSLASGCMPPYRLQSMVQADGQVSLSWKHRQSGIPVRLRYRLQGEIDWIDSVETTQLSQSLHKLQPCTAYEWQLTTICSNPLVIYSPIRSFLTEGCCESDFVAVLPATNDLQATWTPYAGVTTYFLAYRVLGKDTWIEQVWNTTTGVLTDLDSCTRYELRIGMDCPAVGVRWTDTLQTRTLGCGSCQDLAYCSSIATNASFEWIEAIQVGNFENQSGSDVGYGDFAETVIPIPIDTPLQVRLQPGFLGAAFVERWRVWIDLNQDGRFDERELVLSPTASQTTVVDTLRIEAEQPALQTRMRISMAWYGPAGDFEPKGCEDFGEGEVEDYCVELIAPAVPEPPSAIRLYPNPATNVLFLESPDSLQALQLIDPQGRELPISWQEVRAYQWRIDLPALAAGVYYLRVMTATEEVVKVWVKP